MDSQALPPDPTLHTADPMPIPPPSRRTRPLQQPPADQVPQLEPTADLTPEQEFTRRALRHAVTDAVMAGFTFGDLHSELRSIASKMSRAHARRGY